MLQKQVLYFFSIDPTIDKPQWGVARFFNHSRKWPNMDAKIMTEEKICGTSEGYFSSTHQHPRVVLVANQDIPAHTQLKYDYGEWDPEVLNAPGNEWITQS